MNLNDERAHAARMAEIHATALAMTGPGADREGLRDGLRFWRHVTDVLDQQRAWEARGTVWAVPAAPAWVN